MEDFLNPNGRNHTEKGKNFCSPCCSTWSPTSPISCWILQETVWGLGTMWWKRRHFKNILRGQNFREVLKPKWKNLFKRSVRISSNAKGEWTVSKFHNAHTWIPKVNVYVYNYKYICSSCNTVSIRYGTTKLSNNAPWTRKCKSVATGTHIFWNFHK